jgi:hypothetical protein
MVLFQKLYFAINAKKSDITENNVKNTKYSPENKKQSNSLPKFSKTKW